MESLSSDMLRNKDLEHFWSLSADGLMEQLSSGPNGLTSTEAKRRIRVYGPNRLHSGKRTDAVTLLLAQSKSPLILI